MKLKSTEMTSELSPVFKGKFDWDMAGGAVVWDWIIKISKAKVTHVFPLSRTVFHLIDKS